MSNEEHKAEVSVYNEASLQIQRLDNLWRKIEIAFESGKLDKVKFLHDGIWRELIADVIKNDKKEKWLQTNEEIRAAIAEIKDQGLTEGKQELYEFLNDRHEFLKIIQDSVGKGSKYQETGQDDFE